ncbi:hypothetical protein [Delftia sp. PS-11]|uniref:hypothetical protein n=1 Tax=Delftia sp. PS-11 TaxID=2767222 RepID=UPI00245562A6|nr:hypothetical protein [Delftia sp. PS-11]KAJ8745361.1 hypothetical protein H9T68_08165 [Delftia sp. PS-11]
MTPQYMQTRSATHWVEPATAGMSQGLLRTPVQAAQALLPGRKSCRVRGQPMASTSSAAG